MDIISELMFRVVTMGRDSAKKDIREMISMKTNKEYQVGWLALSVKWDGHESNDGW